MALAYSDIYLSCEPHSPVSSASDSRAIDLGFDTRSGHKLFVSASPDLRKEDVSYWQKYMYLVLVNHLGGLSLPRNSVVRLTDHPTMTIIPTWP